jgi:RNA polymerase sigma-70 factor (ECF subfamily)
MAVPAQAFLSRAVPIMDAAADPIESWVRLYARFVYQVAFAVLRNHHDAEDVTQETFLGVLRHQSELGAIGRPRAWLARIAWRLAVDRRRKAPEIPLEAAAGAVAELRAGGVGVERLAADRQMLALLEGLIASLPVSLRDAVILSTVQEMSSAEAAVVLGIPEASVRTRLHRARQLLRQKLEAVLGSRHGN